MKCAKKNVLREMARMSHTWSSSTNHAPLYPEQYPDLDETTMVTIVVLPFYDIAKSSVPYKGNGGNIDCFVHTTDLS